MDKAEKAQFNLLCSELDAQYLPLYHTVQALGVPRDQFQKFWEFAHQPTRWYQTLAEEITLLMRADLIPVERNLSLHVTLGNSAFASGSYYVQLLTEMSGGSTGERIRQAVGDMPIYERRWARKAENGTKERRASELQGANAGFEMRTLLAQTPRQVQRVLKTAQLLGAALNGYRRSEKKDDELAQFWKQAVRIAKSLEGAGVEVGKPWRGPQDDPKLWLAYADLLDGKDGLANSLEYVRSETAQLCEDIETVLVAS